MRLIASSNVGEWIAVGSLPTWNIAHQIYSKLEAYCQVSMRFICPWIYTPYLGLIRRGKENDAKPLEDGKEVIQN